MNMSKPINISDNEFESKVLQSDKPVLVDFWAPWCGPCKMVAPVLDELAQEKDGDLVIAKVNVDENQQHAAKYGVQGIPTMLLFVNGEIADRLVGAHPKAALSERINSALGVAS
jgi:thioredoxin 1